MMKMMDLDLPELGFKTTLQKTIGDVTEAASSSFTDFFPSELVISLGSGCDVYL